MYKELIISFIIVISIFALDFMTQKYTDMAINDSVKDLNSIREAIKEENVNSEKVVKDASKKYEKWLKYHDTLAFFIEHHELETVETSFVAGKSFIETEKYEDALSELDKTIFVLNHINEKYSVNLANIF